MEEFHQRLSEKDIDETITTSRIYRQFKSSAEYNCNWLNTITQTIIFDPNDQVLVPDWTPVKVRLDQTFGATVKNSLTIFFFFTIYAILAFIFLDGMQKPINNAVQAFFFPIMPYLLVCYRRFDTYIKALITSGIILFITIFLFRFGFITLQGVVFLKWILPIYQLLQLTGYLPELLTNPAINEVFLYTVELITGLFILEFILLIIRAIFHSGDRLELIVTKFHLYVKAKTKTSIFGILYMFLWIALNPFNVKNYKDIADRIRYNKAASKLGQKWDFSKIPLDAVNRIEKQRDSSWGSAIFGIILLVIGIIPQFIPLILLGALIFFLNIIPKRTYTIMIVINRKKVEGSWVLSHDKTILRLSKVPEDLAQYFHPYRKK
jgi:hypothetical protein